MKSKEFICIGCKDQHPCILKVPIDSDYPMYCPYCIESTDDLKCEWKIHSFELTDRRIKK
jgi:hypothetical protein